MCNERTRSGRGGERCKTLDKMSFAVVAATGGTADTANSWYFLGESDSWLRGLKLVAGAGGLATSEWGGEAASVAGTAAKIASSRELGLTLVKCECHVPM